MPATFDILEVRIASSLGTQAAINVRHYLVSNTAGTGATYAQIAAALNTQFAAPMKAMMAAGASYRGVGVKRLRPSPPTLETVDVSSPGAGTVVGDALPTQCAGLISLRTTLSGRRNRGRFYVPFPGEADSDSSGLPSSGYITRANTLAVAIAATLTPGVAGNTHTLVPVIYSRVGDVSAAISTFVLPSKWATQRRRGSFGRANALPF